MGHFGVRVAVGYCYHVSLAASFPLLTSWFWFFSLLSEELRSFQAPRSRHTYLEDLSRFFSVMLFGSDYLLWKSICDSFCLWCRGGPIEEKEMTHKDYDMSELQKLVQSFGMVSVLPFPSNFSCLLRSIEPQTCERSLISKDPVLYSQSYWWCVNDIGFDLTISEREDYITLMPSGNFAYYELSQRNGGSFVRLSMYSIEVSSFLFSGALRMLFVDEIRSPLSNFVKFLMLIYCMCSESSNDRWYPCLYGSCARTSSTNGYFPLEPFY